MMSRHPLPLLALAGAIVAAADSGRAPALFAPGVVSSGDSESHATLSPDGRSLFFVKLTPDFAHWTVVASQRTGRGWSEPAVAWFSGLWDDADVSFSPDGTTLYFISNRPERESGAARPDTDIFRIRRDAGGWGAPERIAELASPGNEWFPNQASGGALYFGSERREGNLGPEGTADLWRARWLGGRFGPPESLGPTINTAGEDIEPWVSPDESCIVFTSKGRPDSLGSYDLYASFRRGDAWSEPRPLAGGVNSPGWEFAGRFSPDGSTFLFASNRPREPFADAAAPRRGREGYGQLLERLRSPGNGLFDIYAIDTAALGLDSPCPATSPAPAAE